MKINLIRIMLPFIFLFGLATSSFGQFKVEYVGTLKNMMHRGDISAKLNLSRFEDVNHMYALGAMENLKGEIQIFNGNSVNSVVQNNQVKVDSTFNAKATLLVYTTVSKWQSVMVPDTVVTNEQLEQFVAWAAEEHRVELTEPFPFLVQGTASMVSWHVINWKDGDREHSHEKHKISGLSRIEEEVDVELLGFYSSSHHAVFTHHSTNIHVHFRTTDNRLAGHVDNIRLGKNMLLKLPLAE